MYVNEKVAIVTGGIRGIGFVTVQQFLRNGAKYVAIFDLHKFDSKTVVDGIAKLEQEFSSEKFGYYVCDVTNAKEFIARYEEVSKLKSYVDILVNNAGVCLEKKPELMIGVNFTAVVTCTMSAIERMGKHNGHKGGCVVNIGSIYALVNSSFVPIYTASKHAVVSFVRSMKDHNETIGVRIMCICPGMARTDMAMTGNRDDNAHDFIPETMVVKPLTRLQDPNNVALAIVEILEKGKGGDVWLAKNDEPPFNIRGEETDLENLRVPF